MSTEKSPLEKARDAYKPKLPPVLSKGIGALAIEESGPTTAAADAMEIENHFPKCFGLPVLRFVPGKGPRESKALSVGVVLSGGQAPGGHNVITGLFDGIKAIHKDSRLFGFRGGPKGLFTKKYTELTAEFLDPYRNTGGFDMIGSGRDKIEKPEHLADCRKVADEMQLDAIVIIGGDDSNTNAAVLAEYFQKEGAPTRVIGVPKTIDGDLKSEQIEISFGFDTTTKVYSELIGNICRDAASARKYWHFIKLMGRNASHVTLECALQTQPNITLIGEEVSEKEYTLAQVVEQIANVVWRRAEAGLKFGICLVPEGLIEFIPEIRLLIKELNVILHDNKEYFDGIRGYENQIEFINQKLSRESSYVFSTLPHRIQQQLLLDRDSHGNVQVSKIETEKLLIEQVDELLAERKAGMVQKARKEQGDEAAEKLKDELKKKFPFNTQSHFFGYEGRCSAPSNFDADYTYSLGMTASVLIAFGKTSYMCAVSNLAAPVSEWTAGGVPLVSLMNIETRKGKRVPVIRKALVETNGAPFKAFAAKRDGWEMNDEFVFPGAIQYFGPAEVCDAPTKTLRLERGR